MATLLTAEREEQRDPSEGERLPLLIPGDHVDRATFHARYKAMPGETFAELVGGVVYMPPRYAPHGKAHSELISWLVGYKAGTPGVEALDNATILLADDGEPQPDGCLIIAPERGGRTRLEGDCIAGAPELVAEVAYCSAAYDLYSKKRDYERAGVREYVVVILREQQVRWFALRRKQFAALAPGEDGVLRSEVFPGLWLDPAALLRRDTNAVRATLEQGLATPEHAEFARGLSG